MPVFDWYSSNTKIAYPFEDYSPDGLNELFVDAYIVHNRLTTEPQKVKITHFDPISATKRLVLKFEDNTVLADLSGVDLLTTVNFKSKVFGKYTIYEWRKQSSINDGFTGEEIIAHLVVLTSALGSFSFPVEPIEDVFLLSSLVNPHIKIVRKIALKQPGFGCDLLVPPFCDGPLGQPGGFAEGAVAFEAGYNMQITRGSSDLISGLGLTTEIQTRAPQKIIFDVIPGAGKGTVQTCSDDASAIKTLNAQKPDDDGDAHLEGLDCLWVERGGDLTIHADCKPCCECEDYGTAYEQLVVAWDRAKILGERVKNLVDKYNGLKDTMLEIREKTCPVDVDPPKVLIRLEVLSRPDYHLAVGVAVFNNSMEDITDLDIVFDIPSGFEYTEGSALITISGATIPITMWPHSVPAQLGGVIFRPGKTLWYSYEVRYPSKSAPSFAQVEVTVTGTVGISPETFVSSFQGAVPLHPPLEKK
jgi:hypothetical protein